MSKKSERFMHIIEYDNMTAISPVEIDGETFWVIETKKPLNFAGKKEYRQEVDFTLTNILKQAKAAEKKGKV